MGEMNPIESTRGHEQVLQSFWRSQFMGLETAPYPAIPNPEYRPALTAQCDHEFSLFNVTKGAADQDAISTDGILHLAWAIVLSHFTGLTDMTFGTAVRPQAADMRLMETLTIIPFRATIDFARTGRAVVTAMQEQRNAIASLPSVELHQLREYSPEAEMACAFHNELIVLSHDHEEDIPSSSVKSRPVSVVCKLDACNQRVGVAVSFDPNVIPQRQVRRLLQYLETACQLLVGNLDERLYTFPRINAFDLAQLGEWNGALPQARSDCVHDLIRFQCSKHPDSEAVSAFDGSFTYRELDEVTDCLAGHQIRRGVGPNVIVAVLCEKSCWLPIAAISVLKAGGAVLLLQPSYPVARLKAICQTADCKLLLTSAQQSRTAQDLGIPILSLARENIQQPFSTPKWPQPTPSDAAYVVFTSGSTGDPKGIVIQHSGICTTVEHHFSFLDIGHQSRVLQFSSNAFDICILDIFGTLIQGGCLCVPSDTQRLDGCMEFIDQFQVSHAILTPAFARTLRRQTCSPHFKTLALAGEAVTKEDLTQWENQNIRLVNLYGPAECSAATTARSCFPTTSSSANIGRGLGGVCWLVDTKDSNCLVPIGAVGEILIEGPIVGRGYINDPVKTNASFIEPPPWLRDFRGDGLSETRLYKTGDLARYEEDGTLIFMGRTDFQVKLRGQRVELGEIERQMQRILPDAEGVIVERIQRDGGDSSPFLVGCVCERSEKEPVSLASTPEGGLEEMFTQHRIQNPHSLAVQAGEDVLTYQELDDLATSLAHVLVSIEDGTGLPKSQFIPLCCDPSPWLIVAMLAVIKAGAAFIRLDPSSSRRELKDTYRSAKGRLVIASPDYLRLVADWTDAVVVTGDYGSWFPSSPVAASVPGQARACLDQPLFARISSTDANAATEIVDHRMFLSAQRTDWTSSTENIITLASGGCIHIPFSSSEAFAAKGIDIDMKAATPQPAGLILNPTPEFSTKVQVMEASLREKLPGYMVPSVFLPLRYIPTTATEKADRRKVRQTIEALSPSKLAAYRVPVNGPRTIAPVTSPTAVTLREIWATILHLQPEEISADDNFVQLGGDSIASIHVAAAGREQGLVVAVQDILLQPTLTSLAKVAVMVQDGEHPSLKSLEETEPFSLVNDDTKQTVIEVLQHRALISSPSSVADILPVTEAQLFFLREWTPSYHCHSFDGSLDIARLRTAVDTVVSRHSILRSAFIDTRMGIYQAVMHHIDTPFSQISTEEDLTVYCDQVWQDDCTISRTVNEVPVRFILVSSPSSPQHVLLIRLSHAQYDGFSMPILLEDLSAAYAEPAAPRPPPVDFSQYVYWCADQKNDDQVASFWKRYLHSSSMAVVPAPSQPQAPSRNARISVAETIPFPKPVSLGITVGTLIKAATTVVLSRLLGQNDLVLGQAVHARSMPLEGVERILGACVNNVPFRATLQRDWSGSQLLDHVQSQSNRSLGYDYLGLREIARDSTDWPEDVQFGCVVQHQNIEQLGRLRLGGLESKPSYLAHFVPPTGVWVLSMPQTDHLQLVLCTSEQVMARDAAQTFLQAVRKTTVDLTESPERTLDWSPLG